MTTTDTAATLHTCTSCGHPDGYNPPDGPNVYYCDECDTTTHASTARRGWTCEECGRSGEHPTCAECQHHGPQWGFGTDTGACALHADREPDVLGRPVPATPAPVPHLGVVLADGTTITLPVSAWFDQTLARAVLAHAGAGDPPPLDDDGWTELVFRMIDNADPEATR